MEDEEFDGAEGESLSDSDAEPTAKAVDSNSDKQSAVVTAIAKNFFIVAHPFF